MKEINKILVVDCADMYEFFYNWFLYLKPFHKLATREIKALAYIYMYKHELSKKNSNVAEVDAQVLSTPILKEVSNKMGITLDHLKVAMTKIRKLKIIDNKRISMKLMPIIKENNYNVMLKFVINDTKDLTQS